MVIHYCSHILQPKTPAFNKISAQSLLFHSEKQFSGTPDTLMFKIRG